MMQTSKYSMRSPSIASSSASTQQNSSARSKSPASEDYEYVGRLVTRERPVGRPSHSMQQKHVYPSNRYKYHQSMESHERETRASSSDNEDDLSRPLGVIRINDRHFREIYRLPTPPPKIKRVFHRLRSPEPKIIERIYVRRPAPQVIENVIEVPPEKVRIIHRDKFLSHSKPITRSKIVHLKSHREEDGYEQAYASSEQKSRTSSRQSTSTNLLAQQEQPASTQLVYPPQANLRTVGYFESEIPPHIMLKSQQPVQFAPQAPAANPPDMVQPTSYMYQPQYYSQQPQTIPNTPYGYTQH